MSGVDIPLMDKIELNKFFSFQNMSRRLSGFDIFLIDIIK